jgi:lipoate synthase
LTLGSLCWRPQQFKDASTGKDRSVELEEPGKIDTSTRVWEFSNHDVSSLDKDRFPVNIDKTRGGYRVCQWVGPE